MQLWSLLCILPNSTSHYEQVPRNLRKDEWIRLVSAVYSYTKANRLSTRVGLISMAKSSYSSRNTKSVGIATKLARSATGAVGTNRK